MNPKVRIALFLLGLVGLSVGLFSLLTLKNKDKPNLEVARQLLSYINENMPPGTQYKANWKNSVVKPSDNNRYYVTIKDVLFASDATWLGKLMFKDVMKEDNIYPEEYISRAEEFEFLYGPEDNYLILLAMRGVKSEADLSIMDVRGTPLKGFNIKFDKYQGKLGELVCSGLDIGELLKKDKKNSREIMEQFLKGKQKPFEVSLKNMEADVRMVGENGEKTWIRMKFEKLESYKGGITDPYTDVYLYKKGAPTPDLSEILQKGLAIVDSKIELGNVHIAVEKDGNIWGDGVIHGLSLGQYTKPNDARTHFNSGYTFGLKNIDFSIPGNRKFELFSKVTECRGTLSMENLSNRVIMAWLDLMKKGLELQNSAEDSEIREVPIQMEKFKKEIAASNSRVKNYLSPLKHYFGELNVKVDVRPQFSSSFPEGTMSIEIMNISDVLEKLTEAKLIPPFMAPQMVGSFMMLGLVDENGDLSFTAVTKSDKPGIFYVNGIPVPVPNLWP